MRLYYRGENSIWNGLSLWRSKILVDFFLGVDSSHFPRYSNGYNKNKTLSVEV